MQTPYHKCIVGDQFLFYSSTQKNAEILPWLYSWKTIVQLGHPKNVQNPPSKPHPSTPLFIYLHTETNMQNSYWEMKKNIKITTSIAFVIRFFLLFQVHKKRQNLWKENFTSIDVNFEEIESDEHSYGC
jgi:hypothetical protein